MRLTRALTLALFLAAAGLDADAAAQPAAPASADAAGARADDLAHQGNDLALKHKWTEAEALFRQAWALKQSYDISANLGIAELALGKYRDAAEHLTFAFRHFPANGKPEHRDLLKEKLAKAREQVVALTISVNVDGAELLADGRSVGRAPLDREVFVDPGSRTIEARLADYSAAGTTITADKGASQTVTLTLTRIAAPPPTGTVQPPPPGPNKIVLVTGGATAGAAIVTGAVLLGVAAAKGSTVSSLQAQIQQEGGCASAAAGGDCADLRSTATSKQTLGNAGLWMLVAGGGVGVATLVYGLVGGAKAPQPKSGWRVTPAAAPGGGGLVVQGTF
jgi:PEGA domain